MTSPTVVLVHGAWHASWCWANIEQHLNNAGITAIAVDLPGHDTPGSSKRIWNTVGSYVDHVGAVVDDQPGDVVLVGHSMGGLVTQRVLETRSVAAAMLVASIPRRGVTALLARLMRHHPTQVLETLSLSLWPLVSTPERVRQQFFSADTSDEIVRAAGAKLQNESYLALGSMLTRWPRPKAVRAHNTPISVVAARHDTIFTIAEQRALAAAYGVELNIIDCAHDIMLEPEWPELATLIEQMASQR